MSLPAIETVLGVLTLGIGGVAFLTIWKSKSTITKGLFNDSLQYIILSLFFLLLFSWWTFAMKFFEAKHNLGPGYYLVTYILTFVIYVTIVVAAFRMYRSTHAFSFTEKINKMKSAMQWQDFIRKASITVTKKTPISAIAAKLHAQDEDYVLVAEKGKPLGIITDRDIVEKVCAKGQDPRKVMAREIMSSNLITATTAEEVHALSKTMRSNNIKHLVILENNSLVGVLTAQDLIKALTR